MFFGQLDIVTISCGTIVCGRSACQGLVSSFVLGEELRKARLKAGMTQEELAAKARLTREYVSLLELNKRMPTLPVFVRVCQSMNLSAPVLLAKIEHSLGSAKNGHI
jgi:transcriptional regulator with XRE-family HTH domain